MMNEKDKSQNTNGSESRPFNSSPFSAARAGALGVALLMLSAAPGFAEDNLPVNARPDSALWGTRTAQTVVAGPASGAPTKATTTARPDSIVWGGLATVVNTVATGVSAAANKFSPELQTQQPPTDSNGLVTVIVQHKQMPTSAHLRSLHDAGATVTSQFHTIRGVAMRVPASMLADLANDPNVTYISPDRQVANQQWNSGNLAVQGSQSQPTIENEEFATAVEENIAASQFGMTGTSIGVAVIDSGIAPHPDLLNANGTSRVVYNQSFVLGNTSAVDQFGHGTHVAGLVGGNGSDSGQSNGYSAVYAGMATNVNLINLRVLDALGLGTDSQVIAAIEEAIALKSKYNIRVINMSLGRPIFESYTLDPVDQAVEAAWKAGIVVVVAAGNDGRYAPTDGFGTIGVPANDPAVITVGATLTMDTATRVDDEIASYSSKGPTAIDHIVKPDLVAPGNHQVSLRVPGSTLDLLYPQFEVGPTSGNGPAMYFRLSGTSMATPVVSGAVAQMLQLNSSLTPDQVKARLMKTAWKGFGQYTQSSADVTGVSYSNEYDIFTYGAGYLDIDAALNNTSLATGVALSPTAIFNTKNDTVSIVNTADSNFAGSSIVWGAASTVFGDSIVWGTNVVSSTSIVWGATSIVWGATSVSGDSIVWGATSTALADTSALGLGDPGDN